MFDRKVRLLTEGLARSMGRRKFLTQASAAVFAGVATLAAGRTLGNTASAQQKGEGADGQQPPADPFAACQAPNGVFCSVNMPDSSDGCQGAYCFQNKYNGQVLECRLSYNWGYAVGCWTVMSQTGGAYWTCCDCDCSSTGNFGPSAASCGCARYSVYPVPVAQ
ncbi:MAG: hypothetical protein QOH93_3269 [Chloroflexia bacterium]|jgi:hypothetical protein|nr:hypothetical protein [Chloroflexia bacterium]